MTRAAKIFVAWLVVGPILLVCLALLVVSLPIIFPFLLICVIYWLWEQWVGDAILDTLNWCFETSGFARFIDWLIP